ncbi:MAG: prolipoprotein diacylglyceryl transferase [Candidatus Aminicenantaceae bacterium]
MHPILIKIGSVTIHSYGFMMAIGVIAAFLFVYYQGKKQGLPASKIIDMGFFVVLISLIGAKLILFIGDISLYINNPKELLSLLRSGGVFQGGLAFGFVFALWYMWKHKLPIWKVADIVAPGIALGHGFGRIGCFLAGCCFGRESSMPWGVTFSSQYASNITGVPLGVKIHPTQLYESVLNFLNFFVLFYLLKKKKFDGQVFAFYIINYSILRFFVEFYRWHPDKYFLFPDASFYLKFSFHQIFCVVGLAAGLILLMILRKRKSA